jgi:membrane associated rhomboid family serine protease
MKAETGLGTLILLALTCLVSLIGIFIYPQLVRRALFRPYWLVRGAQYATLITSGFVHADLAHLLFNGITLYSFGFLLEHHIGTLPFLVLYFSGLLVSNVGTYFKHRGDPHYSSLGASGAILAVLFASIVYFPSQRLYILPIPFPIPAPLFAVGYLAYSYYSARRARDKINHDAHVSGALTGLTFVALTDPAAYSSLLNAGFR